MIEKTGEDQYYLFYRDGKQMLRFPGGKEEEYDGRFGVIHGEGPIPNAE